MNDEYLTRCVVNTSTKTFNLFSSEGSERVVECETIEQFMNVLEVVRERVSENDLYYVNPL